MAKELFDEVFNKVSIYKMLFFNVKAVLEHPTLEDLEEKNKPMYERWKYLSKTKYDCDLDLNLHPINDKNRQVVYEEHAVNYPEFCRIVAISYASLYPENGQVKRDFKKIVNLDESLVIATFMDVLYQLSSDGIASTPQFFPTLSGHNIVEYDIPLLIKRFLLINSKAEIKKQLPLLLKRSLAFKPWDAGGIVDTVNVWKFNGHGSIPLMVMGDFLGLKKTVDVLDNSELSRYYWDNIDEKEKETLDFMSLQSATHTNIAIQLMNELRQY